MKYFLLALVLCAAAGVFAVAVQDSADWSQYPAYAYPAYAGARKDHLKQISYCSRVPVMSAEYEVMCQDLPAERAVGPE